MKRQGLTARFCVACGKVGARKVVEIRRRGTTITVHVHAKCEKTLRVREGSP